MPLPVSRSWGTQPSAGEAPLVWSHQEPKDLRAYGALVCAQGYIHSMSVIAAAEQKIWISRAPACGYCEQRLPALGWTVRWLAVGRRAARAHAESLAGRAGPVLVRWAAGTADEVEYRGWLKTQLFCRGLLPPEPSVDDQPEASSWYERDLSLHARGRSAYRQDFEAERYGWSFEEDAPPPWRVDDAPNTGVQGRPPLLVHLGGGDLQPVLRDTIEAVGGWGRHLRELRQLQGPVVRCTRGHYAGHAHCPRCGEPMGALAHVVDALTDAQLAGWFSGYRAAIRVAAEKLAVAIVAQPSWSRTAALRVLADYLELTPLQLRKLSRAASE